MRSSLFVLAGLLLCGATARAQTTWYVDIGGTPPGTGTQADPYTSIQYAIDQPATENGDTIRVAPGTYVENVDSLKVLTIVSAAGPLETTIIPASPTTAVFLHLFGVLEGFTITGSAATAVRLGDAGSLVRCIVRDNGSLGVWGEQGSSVFQCTIVGNGTGVFIIPQACCCEVFPELTVTSSIVWANGNDVSQGPSTGTVVFSGGLADLPASWCQASNVHADPRFWDLAGADLHLRPDSPCIGTGQGGADMGALAFDAFHAPGTAAYCFGDALTCPCGNGGSGSAGCDIAQATGGIALRVQNFEPDGAGGGTVELFGTGYPAMSAPGVTLIRSAAPQSPPSVFGDGLLCVAPPVVRIGATLASGGVSLNPAMHGAGAGTFHYQVWVRNTPVSFCDASAGFNLSNGVSIVWP